MSNQGLGLLSHFYIGFVCFVLILGPDIRQAFTGPLVLWFLTFAQNIDRGYTLELPHSSDLDLFRCFWPLQFCFRINLP